MALVEARVEKGVLIEYTDDGQEIGIYGGDFDPSVGLGLPAPIGSVFFHLDGKRSRKIGSNNVDWGTSTDASNAINGVVNVSNDVLIDGTSTILLLDTTPAVLNVTLPDAALYTDRFFYIKRVVGSKKANILAATSPNVASDQFIDGSPSYVLQKLNNSVQLVSNGVDWYII